MKLKALQTANSLYVTAIRHFAGSLGDFGIFFEDIKGLYD